MNEIQTDRMTAFCELALIRHEIYVAKEIKKLPKPWTQDKIFQRSFFCNTFRHLDKTSQWIINNIIKPYERDKDCWKKLIVARFFSRMDALEDIRATEGLGTVEAMREGIKRRVVNGLPVQTGGFCVGSFHREQPKFEDPFIAIPQIEAHVDMNYYFSTGARQEEVYEAILPYYGIGKFLAYQYVQDFAYSDYLLKGAVDEDTWSMPGPGAVRGMNRILTGQPGTRDPDIEYPEFSKDLLKYYKAYTRTAAALDGPNFAPFNHIKMCDVQHWLCEYDKYMRGGSSKRRYEGV